MKKLLLTVVFALFLISFATALTDVSTCQDLQDMNLSLDEDYRMINDIDCGAFGNFNSIGDFSTGTFTGTFDGQGYTISNLYSDESVSPGLFGHVENITVSNLIMDNCTSISQTYYASCVVAFDQNSVVSTIANVSVINNR